MELTNLKKRTYERCTLKNRSCDWKDLLAAMASVFLASTITIWKKIADQSFNWRFPKFLWLIFYATLTRQGLLLKSLKNNQSWTSCTSPLMILYCRVCQLLRACWDWEFAWPWKNKYLHAVFYWRFSLIYFQCRQAAYYSHHCHYTIVAAEFSGAPPFYATNKATMSSEILGKTNHIYMKYKSIHWWYLLPTANGFFVHLVWLRVFMTSNSTCIRFSINDFACSLFNTDKPPTTGTIAIFQLFAAEFSGRFSFLLTTYTPSLPFTSLPSLFFKPFKLYVKTSSHGSHMFKNENVFLTSTG